MYTCERETEHMTTDLKDKQIEIIALMNSWVFSRLITENESAGESLAREMGAVAEAEREQGMSLLLPLTSKSTFWTIFFLNQTPFNMIEPVLALETPDSPGKEDKSELLFVLNLVRTKHDRTVRR
jgi:hypothetical protein